MFRYERRLVAQYLCRVRIAAIRLFGPQKGLQKGFLGQLTLGAVKQAFRFKARRYHPDLYVHDSPAMLEYKRQRFITMKEAYEVLKDFLTTDGGGANRASPDAGV